MNTAKKTAVLARKTWLAGVGVYDSGREKAANKFDQLFVDGAAFVNDLLEKGESVESQIQAKLEARKMLKDKISALKSKLGFGNESRQQQIDMLSQRVDSLIEVVAKIAQQKAVDEKTTTVSATKKVAPKPAAPKPAAPKPAAAKPAAVKPAAAKPAAAKPAATKPAAAKPAAAKPAAAKPAAAKPAAAKPAADAKD
jgi:polyhydroxyalkanoate synthesis regulator phasin